MAKIMKKNDHLCRNLVNHPKLILNKYFDKIKGFKNKRSIKRG